MKTTGSWKFADMLRDCVSESNELIYLDWLNWWEDNKSFINIIFVFSDKRKVIASTAIITFSTPLLWSNEIVLAGIYEMLLFFILVLNRFLS